MTDLHPNIALLARLDIEDLDASADLFAPDFVWHYINPNLPTLAGDYRGVPGLKRFFGALTAKTHGTFAVEPLSTTLIGNEFVVLHVRDRLSHDGHRIALDAVVVWRIVAGKFAEAWDIPATHDIDFLDDGAGLGPNGGGAKRPPVLSDRKTA